MRTEPHGWWGVQRDLEGEVTDTRRGVTSDLVKAMCSHFEAPTSQLCMAEIDTLLAQYAADNSKWQALNPNPKPKTLHSQHLTLNPKR